MAKDAMKGGALVASWTRDVLERQAHGDGAKDATLAIGERFLGWFMRKRAATETVQLDLCELQIASVRKLSLSVEIRVKLSSLAEDTKGSFDPLGGC